MSEIHIIKEPIKKSMLKEIAQERFGDFVKGVVDVRQKIMALGGELHADEEVLLCEKYNTKREDGWGINLYPDKAKDEMIEFDSVINIKPLSNRSRDVENPEIKKQITDIINKLIID